MVIAAVSRDSPAAGHSAAAVLAAVRRVGDARRVGHDGPELRSAHPLTVKEAGTCVFVCVVGGMCVGVGVGAAVRKGSAKGLCERAVPKGCAKGLCERAVRKGCAKRVAF